MCFWKVRRKFYRIHVFLRWKGIIGVRNLVKKAKHLDAIDETALFFVDNGGF